MATATKKIVFSAPVGGTSNFDFGDIISDWATFNEDNGVESFKMLEPKAGSSYRQVRLINGDNEHLYVTLSQSLTSEYNEGLVTVGQLLSCNVSMKMMEQKDRETGEVILNKNGKPVLAPVYWLYRPQGSSGETFNVAEVEKEEYKPIRRTLGHANAGNVSEALIAMLNGAKSKVA